MRASVGGGFPSCQLSRCKTAMLSWLRMSCTTAPAVRFELIEAERSRMRNEPLPNKQDDAARKFGAAYLAALPLRAEAAYTGQVAATRLGRSKGVPVRAWVSH